MKDKIFFGLFVAFLMLRIFFSGAFSFIHTIVSFSVPIIFLSVKKDFHIFAFEINDTIQSVLLNSLFGFIFGVALIVIFSSFGAFNWVTIFDYDSNLLLLSFLMSFFYEILIRYFVFGFFLKWFNPIYSIILSSVIGGVLFLPNTIMSVSYLVAGLFFGFVFYKTNDIYGVSVGNFILRICVSVL